MLSSNVKNKKCAPKFLQWKKLRKIPMIFQRQILALFDTSSIHQFTKFNKFLRTCWFLAKKNFYNFVPLPWKLHNPYCHRVHTYIFRWKRNKKDSSAFLKSKSLTKKYLSESLYLLPVAPVAGSTLNFTTVIYLYYYRNT